MAELKLDKESLREEFSKDYQRYYSTKLFEEEGFKRHKCRICGKYFWSIEDMDTCGDPIHTPYSFFKEKPREIPYTELWRRYADFFKKNGHEVIGRYPVVSRWRPDLYFTIADVQDFQRLENGRMSFEYPANPLVVPQICLRFNDIENVGVTGGHYTSFMMAGQKAFNYPKEGYWRDETLDLNFKFLTQVMGVKKEDLSYTEDVWAMGDFSEFGPCIESLSNGTELVNSVFTEFESFNGNVRELEGKVVDVGWGFERLLWFYTGYDNSYEATFHGTLKKLKNVIDVEFDDKLYRKLATYAGSLNIDEIDNLRKAEDEILKRSGVERADYLNKIKPMQATYAILDHTRTLLFAITDGALPSNVGGGYNLRVILRRALSFIEEYKINIDLTDLAERIANDLKPLYPELLAGVETFGKVLYVEKERHRNAKTNARRIVESTISKSARIDEKTLKTLYESHGVTPEFLSAVAREKGVSIEVPEGGYYTGIMTGDFAKREKEGKISVELPELPKTEQLYYNFESEAEATVLYASKNFIVLDRTPFYPEGGGQLADTGVINGMKVKDVQKVNGVIVHITEQDVEGRIKKGEKVYAKVDVERRKRLIAHHTATHLITSAARQVLGKHAWQEGATKGVNKAHVDIAHYEKLSSKEILEIERIVNNELQNGIRVSLEELQRGEAEQKYGFTIYQGHGVPSKVMRIIVIRDANGKLIDAEACGGLHAIGMENMIGMVKIIDSFRVHDGVDRIEFVAGPAALEYFEKEHEQLDKIAQAVNSDRLSAYEGVKKLQDANRALYKSAEAYKELIASSVAETLEEGAGGIVEKRFDEMPAEILRKVASYFADKHRDMVILLTNKHGELVCVSGDDSKVSAIEVVKEKFKDKFKGGGSKKAAEGRVL